MGVYFLLWLSCFGRTIPLCGGNHQLFYTTLGKTNMLRINYALDTGYSDISKLPESEQPPADKVNKYANATDTITLNWYYNYGFNSDSLMRGVVEKRLAEKSGVKNAEIESIEFEEFTGYIVSYIYQNRHEIMVYGSDIFSRAFLFAEFNSKTNNSGRGQMDCLLSSMHFR